MAPLTNSVAAGGADGPDAPAGGAPGPAGGRLSARRAAGLLLAPVAFAWFVWGPAPAGTTQPMRAAAALTAVMAVLWVCESIPLAATALLPLVLLPALGVGTAAHAAAPYANDLIFLFLGGFILANGVEHSGLHRRVALGVVSVVGAGPRALVGALMGVTAFTSLWVSNTAAALLMMPVGLSVVRVLAPPGGGGPAPRRFAAAMVVGVAAASTIGGMGTPFGSTPNLLLVSLARQLYGRDIGFVTYAAFGLPLVIAYTAAAWGLLVFVLFPPHDRLAAGGRAAVVQARRDLGPMTRTEALVGAVFTAMVLGWVFREPWTLGGWRVGLNVWWPGLSDGTIAIAGALALFAVPVSLRPLRLPMDWAAGGKVPWDVVLLFGGGLSLADGIQRSGLDRMLVAALGGMTAGVPPWLTLVLLCAAGTLFSEIASNTATAALLLPLVGSLAVGLGRDPMFLMLPVMFATSLGMMLPAATPPNALALASGHVTVGQMAWAGFLLNVIGLAFAIAACYLLGFPALGVR